MDFTLLQKVLMRLFVAWEHMSAQHVVMLVLAVVFTATLYLMFVRKDEAGILSGEELLQLQREAADRESAVVHNAHNMLYGRLRRELSFCGTPVLVSEHVSGRPLGTAVWDGALVLCEFFANPVFSKQWAVQDWAKTQSVLELGSGTGLVGLLLARLGAPSVLLTDLPVLLPLLEENVALNGEAVTGRVEVAELTWGEDTSDTFMGESSATPRSFDVVVGGDVLYVDAEVFQQLLSTLLRVTGDDTVCYLAGAKRHKDEKNYLSQLREHFDVKEIGKVRDVVAPPAPSADKSAQEVQHEEAERYRQRGWSIRNPSTVYLLELHKHQV